jgi:hypothetical protein
MRSDISYLKLASQGAFMGLPPIHEEFETYGIDIYHFESCKIKEGWENAYR